MSLSVDVWKIRVPPVEVTTLVDPVCSSSVRIIALLEPSENVIVVLIQLVIFISSQKGLKGSFMF